MNPSAEKCRKILSVPENASLEEIKEAYLDLATVWHPDRFAGNSRLEKKATEKLQEINRAYSALVAYYEAGWPEDGTEAGDGQKGPAHRRQAEQRAQAPEKRKPRAFLFTLLILCCAVAFVAALQHYLLQRRTESIVAVAPRGTHGESSPESRGGQKMVPPGPEAGKGGIQERGGDKKHRYGGSYFTLGSTKEHVSAVQGPPPQMSEQRWTYGSSHVEFANGRVSGWYNSSLDPLKVRLASKKTEEDSFAVGSTKAQVASVQGTPTRIEGERWNYGFSRIDFSRGKVAGWYNSPLDPLRIRMVAKAGPERPFFTKGSTKSEVLAVQGTPTQLSETRWSYGYSYIDFENGKVIRWYNSEQDPLAIEEEK